MQVQILSGIYSDNDSDFRTSYPRNMVPVPKKQGISNGYLRPADGIDSFATGSGGDRGAFNWNDVCYRVSAGGLIRVDSDGTVTTIGSIAGSDQVTMNNSFDYLSITGGNNLYLYNGTTLAQVTDTDLGNAIDHIWINGFFMTTDGENLVLTDLNDPFSVNPFKYGSSEVDPDPVKGLLKLQNEAYALNRYTVETFRGIQSSGFAFQRVEGAQLQRGVLGTHCKCVFQDSIAFLGSGRKEAPAIWLGRGGATVKLSTREVDQILSDYTEATLALCRMEATGEEGHQNLMLHLPDQCLVYDAAASRALQLPVWYTLSGGIVSNTEYPAINHVYVYDKWIVGDPSSSRIGTLSDSVSEHYGTKVGWDFDTIMLYNESRGAIVHEVELVALTGRTALGDDPKIYTSHSLDGQIYSMEQSISAGKQGNRSKRLAWFPQGSMDNYRSQKFRGTSDCRASFARLEARLEPLVH